MMQPLETEHLGRLTVEVHYDEDPMSPREWDHIGVMVCGHRDYELGDEQVGSGSLDDVIADAKERGATVILPLYLYDHSGISMSAGSPNPHWFDAQGWDTSLVGIIFDTDESREKMGTSPEHVEEVLRAEVEEYDAYLRGNVFGYMVKDGDEILQSCWGFYDVDYAMHEGLAVAEYALPEVEHEHTNRLVGPMFARMP